MLIKSMLIIASIFVMFVGACLMGAAAALYQMGHGWLPFVGSILTTLCGFVAFMHELRETL